MASVKDTIKYFHLSDGSEILEMDGYKEFKRVIDNIDRDMFPSYTSNINISDHHLCERIKNDYLHLTKDNSTFVGKTPIILNDKNITTVNAVYDPRKKELVIKDIQLGNEQSLLNLTDGVRLFARASLLAKPNTRSINEYYTLADTISKFYELVETDSIENSLIQDVNGRKHVINFLQQRLVKDLADVKENLDKSEICDDLIKNSHSVFRTTKSRKYQEKKLGYEKHVASFASALLLYDRYKNDPIKTLNVTNQCLAGEKSVNEVLKELSVDLSTDKATKVLHKTYNLK